MQIFLLETLLKAKKKKTCAHINFTYLPHIDKFCDTGEKKMDILYINHCAITLLELLLMNAKRNQELLYSCCNVI